MQLNKPFAIAYSYLNSAYLCAHAKGPFSVRPEEASSQLLSSGGVRPSAPFLSVLFLFSSASSPETLQGKFPFLFNHLLLSYLFVKRPFSRKTYSLQTPLLRTFPALGGSSPAQGLPRPSFLNFKQYGLLKLSRLLLFTEEESFTHLG